MMKIHAVLARFSLSFKGSVAALPQTAFRRDAARDMNQRAAADGANTNGWGAL
jgi:hypothetical protein